MVSLTFGQITSLPARVLEDDEDQEQQIHQEDKRSYELECSSEKAQLLIVTTCPMSKFFSETYLLPKDCKRVGTIREQHGDDTTRTVATIHRLEAEGGDKDDDDVVLACHVEQGLDEYFVRNLADKIVSLSQGSVVTLAADHLSSFRTYGESDELGAPLTRCLATTEWSGKYKTPSSCPGLDRPNVLSGLTAAVLTSCEFSKRPGVALLNYCDSLVRDTLNLKGFEPLHALSEVAERRSKLYVNQTVDASVDERRKKRLAKEQPSFGSLYL